MNNFLCVFLLFFSTTCYLNGQSNYAQVINVDYEHLNFNGDVKITYDLINCSSSNYYYVYVYFEDEEIRHKTFPSDAAIIGAGKNQPVRCGYNQYLIWMFSQETQQKRLIGNGEFVVEVFVVPQAEVRYVRRYERIDRRLLLAESQGKDGRVRRLERRRQRIENRQNRRYGH